MKTETGRKMAQKRHQFMEQFLQQFFQEWEGEFWPKRWRNIMEGVVKLLTQRSPLLFELDQILNKFVTSQLSTL
jgi:hypothetical protein